MDIIAKITEELKVKKWQVEAAIGLIDEGNTIPFISRYRKEATGSLNDEQLRDLDERLKYLRGLEERKETVLASIEEQGKLTDELKQKINDSLSEIVKQEELQFDLTVSIGTACLEETDELKDLIARADRSMYDEKNAMR